MSNHYTVKIIGPMHAYSYMKNLYENHMFVCMCESIQGKASGAIAITTVGSYAYVPIKLPYSGRV